ncbi:MAG TPA: ribonuclease P protein component [Candidatus Atribacteria bacterium]|nr:ribonuclease P protein component [Candidatus Atribacteria bacterium]
MKEKAFKRAQAPYGIRIINFINRRGIFIKRKLSKTSEFRKIFSEGRRTEGKNLIIFILKNDYNFNRPGIIIKKETGKAVVRNKIKRRLREAFRLINKKLSPGYDIIVLAKNNIKESDYFEICHDLENLFYRGKLFL